MNEHTHQQVWYTSGSSASDSSGYIYYQPTWEKYDYDDNKNNNDWGWYTYNDAEVYINGVPVKSKIEELQEMVVKLYRLVNKLGLHDKKCEELMMSMQQEKVDLDALEKEQEERPLDDRLFEI